MYGLIAEGRSVPDVNIGQVEKLVAWGFVTFHPDRPDVPVALDPDVAARRQVRAMVEEAEQRVARLKALPDLSDQLAGLYERGQWRTGGGSEYIDDVAVVNARLDDVVGGARWEILAAQPGGPRNEVQLNRSLDRDTVALDRGVAKRTLYRDTVRDNATTAEYARTMSTRTTGRRAEYRTLVGPFERAIIVDRQVAFVSNHVVDDAPEHAAWQITDRAVVAYIVAEFEAKWRRANPWAGELRTRGGAMCGLDTVSSAEGVRTTPRQREIMRDAVSGKDQRATAARLGIGVRTLQSEINSLKDAIGVSTLTELGFWWGLSPDRLIDDSPADVVQGDGSATTEQAA